MPFGWENFNNAFMMTREPEGWDASTYNKITELLAEFGIDLISSSWAHDTNGRYDVLELAVAPEDHALTESLVKQMDFQFLGSERVEVVSKGSQGVP